MVFLLSYFLLILQEKLILILQEKLIYFLQEKNYNTYHIKMGASSSLIMNAELELELELDIYLSYSHRSEYLERLTHMLQNMNFRIMDSSIMIQSRNDFSNSEISKYMEEFLAKTKIIFICISKETIKSVTQIMEMNAILDKYPTIQPKIRYVMTDDDYTPITNTELKSIVRNNSWYPLYNEETLLDTTNKILTLLFASNAY